MSSLRHLEKLLENGSGEQAMHVCILRVCCYELPGSSGSAHALS